MGVAEEMDNLNDKNTSMAFAVLRQKCTNGKADEVHKQVFYDLGKDVCPGCGLTKKLYDAKAQIHRSIMQPNTLSIVNDAARPSMYNPKNAPPPVELKCSTCESTDLVSYDSVHGPAYKRIAADPYTCSSCWWNLKGQYL